MPTPKLPVVPLSVVFVENDPKGPRPPPKVPNTPPPNELPLQKSPEPADTVTPAPIDSPAPSLGQVCTCTQNFPLVLIPALAEAVAPAPPLKTDPRTPTDMVAKPRGSVLLMGLPPTYA